MRRLSDTNLIATIFGQTHTTKNPAHSEVHFRHMLLCDNVIHEPISHGKAYSLIGLTNWLQPETGFDYPLIVEQLMIYDQIWGATYQLKKAQEFLICFVATIHEVYESRDLLGRVRVGSVGYIQLGVADVSLWDQEYMIMIHELRTLLLHN